MGVSSYLTIEQLLSMIEQPNQDACMKLLVRNREHFEACQGSSHNHQAWPGGYLDHVREVMNIAKMLYFELASARPLPFTLSDALLVLFLHDVEKPSKYEVDEHGELRVRAGLASKRLQQNLREDIAQTYDVELTTEHLNAMKYAEGELDDYTNTRRVMNPLAAFCHMCDIASARLWFDRPLPQDETWGQRTASKVLQD